MKPYVVVHKDSGSAYRFDTAKDVSTFMWGRDFREYLIYKNRKRFPWLDGDLAAFQKALEETQ